MWKRWSSRTGTGIPTGVQRALIERLTGDGKKEDLIAPLWTADKLRVLGGIDQTLDHWGTWQGRYFTGRENRIRDFLNREKRGSV